MRFDEEINEERAESVEEFPGDETDGQFDLKHLPGLQASIVEAEAAFRARVAKRARFADMDDGPDGDAGDCAGTKRPRRSRGQEVGGVSYLAAQEVWGDVVEDKIAADFRVFLAAGGGAVRSWFNDSESASDLGYYVCPFFTVVGDAVDPSTDHECLAIQFRDRFNRPRDLLIPRGLIAEGGAKLASFLAANSFPIPPGKKLRERAQLLLHELHGPRVTIARRTGWHDRLFVLPGKVLGEAGSTRVIADLADSLKISQRGSFKAWRDDVAALCQNNSRLQLALSVSFASVLLPFAPSITPVMCHIWGPSSIGKSTIGGLAGSPWGGADGSLGYSESWNGTLNAHLAKAAMRSHTLLVLDELKTGENVTKMAYALSSGQGRSRLDKSANLRSEEKFSVFSISTGEVTFEEMERNATPRGQSQTFDGAELRLPSIPADAGARMGAFEDTHEFETPAAFADHLQSACRANYGHAGPRFVESLLEHIDTFEGDAAFSAQLAKKIDRFVRTLDLPSNADDAVKRLARTFGLIAAAGQLAADFDIIPVPASEMSAGVRKCFDDWLASRGGARSKTGATALAALRDYISKNMGRFIPTTEAGTSQQSVIAGYRQTNGKDESVFYLPISTWNEVLASAPRARLIEELDKLGLLINQKSSKDGTIVKKLSGGISARVYAVSGRILQVDESGKLRAAEDGLVTDDAGNIFDLNVRRAVKTPRSSSR